MYEHLKVCLIGNGLIGKTINKYLTDLGYHVSVYDKSDDFDATNSGNLRAAMQGTNIVVAATPYFLNERIADVALELGLAYFDLTEDVKVADAITDNFTLTPYTHDAPCIPQCGLAPGVVSVIAYNLASEKNFDEVRQVKMRVGALPVTSSNRMKYYLSWSSDGLINEYMNPCPAKIDDEDVMLQPLEGYERLVLDGIEYEAFNTSGGGGRIDMIPGKNVSYKTIRHVGHRDQMQFLINDLELSKGQIIDIFNSNVPHNQDDVVLIFVDVVGMKDGQLKRLAYFKKIYGDSEESAIQKTTAAGLVSVIECYRKEVYPFHPDSHNISVNCLFKFEDFIDNKYGAIFA